MASGMAWPRYPGIIIGIQLCFLARSLGVDFICRQTLPCDGSWHVQLYIQSRESNHLSLIYMSFLKPVSVGRKMERSDWLGLVMCSFLRQAGGEVGPTCTTWINNGIEVSFPRKTDVLLPEEGGLNVPQTNSLIIQTHTRKIPDVGKKRSILSVVKFKFLVPLFLQPIFSWTMVILSSQYLCFWHWKLETLSTVGGGDDELKILEWHMPLFIMGPAIWDSDVAVLVTYSYVKKKKKRNHSI